ncbi:hypothetical protein OC842_007352 [Tilletia horrida]|uniref:Uncharacterized protein n=1 Tax=Tilletia horrida TaxID=155126 RepID=A0AAN6JMJ2_9BASI|nr:hypothetical protein OC842_007352 [Tilletia horrida]
MSDPGSRSATPTTPHRPALAPSAAGLGFAGRTSDMDQGVFNLLERLSNNMEMMADRFDDFGTRLEHLERRTSSSTPPTIPRAAAAPVAPPSVTFQLPPRTTPGDALDAPPVTSLPPPPATVNTSRSTRGRGPPPHMRHNSIATMTPPAPAQWTPEGTIWGQPAATTSPPVTTSRASHGPSPSSGTDNAPPPALLSSRPTPRDVFRALPTADKEIFRRALELMGQSTRDYLNKVNRHWVPADAVQQAQDSASSTPLPSLASATADSASVTEDDDPAATTTPGTTPSATGPSTSSHAHASATSFPAGPKPLPT